MECIRKSRPHPQHPDSLGQDPRHEPVDLVLVVHDDHHVFSCQVSPFLGVHVKHTLTTRPPLSNAGELWPNKNKSNDILKSPAAFSAEQPLASAGQALALLNTPQYL